MKTVEYYGTCHDSITFSDKGTPMHSFVSCLMHVVFSTKDRQPLISADLHKRFGPYIQGIATKNKMHVLTTGGVEDHVHILLSIPSTMAISKAVQLIKGNSSKWIHEEFSELKTFEWQEGYGAFSIGVSGIEATTAYIARQVEHHRRKTFKSELSTILKKHGIEYEEWMLN